VLSHGFWQGRYGGARDIIGQTIRLDGRPFIVVGVMRQGPGYFWHAINPPGVPVALKFLVVPIEFFSKFLMRPFSLAVRLFPCL